MKRPMSAVVGGALFGFGLGLAGVANPVVINNFLDLAGPHLDFTLLILFVVAVVTTTVLYQVMLRVRERPLWDDTFHLPTRTKLDRPLIIGALIFGVGWGLSGYCVGPALASSIGAYAIALPYLGATMVGMKAYDLMAKRG